VETQIDAGKTTSEINDKNQIEKRFISSQAFHRTSGGHVREITAGERFEPRILKSFDPATQEWTGFNLQHPRITHIAIKIDSQGLTAHRGSKTTTSHGRL
jgi:hypothetical protein